MSLRKWILLSVLFSMLVGCGGPWSSGDRVLVSKLQYDTGISQPNRYDVVVFKYPGKNADEGPMERNTPKIILTSLAKVSRAIFFIIHSKRSFAHGFSDPLRRRETDSLARLRSDNPPVRDVFG